MHKLLIINLKYYVILKITTQVIWSNLIFWGCYCWKSSKLGNGSIWFCCFISSKILLNCFFLILCINVRFLMSVIIVSMCLWSFILNASILSFILSFEYSILLLIVLFVCCILSLFALIPDNVVCLVVFRKICV